MARPLLLCAADGTEAPPVSPPARITQPPPLASPSPSTPAPSTPVPSTPAPGASDDDPFSFPQQPFDTPPYYGQPSPPRTFLLGGLGWAYGVGCGAGPFFGMGVAVNRTVVFGAGAGVGVFCGVGFGAGAVVGHGHGFVPLGLTSSFFYTPRLGWAENVLDRYHRRHGKLRERRELPVWKKRAIQFWNEQLWSRIRPVLRRERAGS